MTSRERVLRLLNGGQPDHLPLMPITMMFAADQLGVKYGDYARKHEVLVIMATGIAEAEQLTALIDLQNNENREYSLLPPVAITQRDIRELQLAKAALASGLRILIELTGTSVDDVKHVYLAGAFGNYVRIASACRVGLLEMPGEKIVPAGNTALRGAKMALLAPGIDKKVSVTHVSLESCPSFEDTFVDCLAFPYT